MRIIIPYRIFILLLLLVAASCSVTRKLGDEESLLVKNKVIVKDKGPDKSKLEGLIQQKSNKKFLWMFMPGAWFYQQGKSQDPDSLNFFQRNLGQKPVIFSDGMAKKSTEYMTSYLGNVGYFHANVDYEVKIIKKKAKVKYIVQANRPHTLDTVRFDIRDTLIAQFIAENKSKSLIKQGMNFNSFKLNNERKRITAILKEKGFYYFTKDNIYYRADTSKKDFKVDVEMVVSNRVNLIDTSYYSKAFYRYKFGNIHVTPAFDLNPDIEDTLKVEHQTRKTFFGKQDKNLETYYFYRDDGFKIRPKVLIKNIFTRPDKYYSPKSVNKTYSKLFNMPVTKYVDIELVDRGHSFQKDENYLDVNIDLRRRKISASTIESEITNNAGDPGMALNITYQNRNIFRGAENFNIRLRGAAEAQINSNQQNKVSWIFNSVESGVDASLDFPKFLFPSVSKLFPRTFSPKTQINVSYNYQKRADYERNLAQTSFGYAWNDKNSSYYQIIPLDFNFIRINTTARFDSILNNYSRMFRQQYSNHLIFASRFIYSTKFSLSTESKDYLSFRGSFEPAGNILRSINKIAHSKKDEYGKYKVFNVRYAQYVRTEADAVVYRYLDYNKNIFAARAYVGLGVPYGNSEIMPFEKGFFSGGPNSLRGWATRSVGPGSFYDSTFLINDKIGDIKFELNLEQRFPIYRFVKGALFVDMGNIWLLRKSSNLPGGHFQFKNFVSELAMDAGFGLRFDFNYLIIRVDTAIPIHYPYNQTEKNTQWKQLNNIGWRDISWNFGIGYPF